MDILQALSRNARFKKLTSYAGEYCLDGSSRQLLMDFVSDQGRMAGLDINAVLPPLDQPLIYAALARNDYEFFELLLSLGGDANAIIDNVSLSSHIILLPCEIRFYQYLQSGGYDYDDPIEIGLRPLSIMVATACHQEEKMLDGKDNIFDDYFKSLRFVVETGIDMNPPCLGNPSPLMTAAQFQSMRILGLLLQKGSDRRKKQFIEQYKAEMDALEFFNHYLMCHGELHQKNKEEIIRALS
jgi:ankyrin repeat protein